MSLVIPSHRLSASAAAASASSSPLGAGSSGTSPSALSSEGSPSLSSGALASPSASSAVASAPCNLYIEELKGDVGLLAPCPACNIAVARHARIPVAAQPSDGRAASGSSTASNKYSDGVKTAVPQWGVDFKVVRSFLDRYEQVLEADNVDPSRYVPMLLKTVSDVNDSTWIKRNIIDKKLSWEEAREAFSRHYELVSLKDQQEYEFYNIKQRSRETPQEFSMRFQRLQLELGYVSTEPLIINMFLNALQQDYRIKYETQLAHLRLTRDGSLAAAEIGRDLEQVIKLILEIARVDHMSQQRRVLSSSSGNSNAAPSSGRSYSAAAGSSSSSSGSSSSSSSGQGNRTASGSPDSRKKDKYCIKHGWGAHDSASCNALARESAQTVPRERGPASSSAPSAPSPPRPGFASGGPSSSPTSSPVFKCHACGQQGHKASDPVCPQFRRTRSQGPAPSSASGPPASNGNRAPTSPSVRALDVESGARESDSSPPSAYSDLDERDRS